MTTRHTSLTKHASASLTILTITKTNHFLRYQIHTLMIFFFFFYIFYKSVLSLFLFPSFSFLGLHSHISCQSVCLSLSVSFSLLGILRHKLEVTHLQSAAVHADIPVGELVNKLHQMRHHSVQMVCCTHRNMLWHINILWYIEHTHKAQTCMWAHTHTHTFTDKHTNSPTYACIHTYIYTHTNKKTISLV